MQSSVRTADSTAATMCEFGTRESSRLLYAIEDILAASFKCPKPVGLLSCQMYVQCIAMFRVY